MPFFDFLFFFKVQLHLQSGSYVSFGEILNTGPDYKYKDVLLSTKSDSCNPAVIRLDVIHERRRHSFASIIGVMTFARWQHRSANSQTTGTS
jgi:hypothetical protein